MGFFSKILAKLGLKKDDEASEPSAPATTVARRTPSPRPAAAPPKPSTSTATLQNHGPSRAARPTAATSKPPAPKPISEVDVVQKLEALAKGKGLNWKTSIADRWHS